MAYLDWAVVAIIVVSAAFAFWRGAAREIVALASWILGIVAGFVFSGDLARALPVFQWSLSATQALAFLIILAAALISGSILGGLLSKVLRSVGLGLLDRLLGAVFGFARGLLLVIVIVLIAGLTPLPKFDWWQSAKLTAPLETGALLLRRHLPEAWARRIDYSRRTDSGSSMTAGRTAIVRNVVPQSFVTGIALDTRGRAAPCNGVFVSEPIHVALAAPVTLPAALVNNESGIAALVLLKGFS